MRHVDAEEDVVATAADGTPLVKLIQDAGSIPGIKVDEGVKPLPECPGETVTIGLDKLADRLPKYYEQGARFAKWRAVITIESGRPSSSSSRPWSITGVACVSCPPSSWSIRWNWKRPVASKARWRIGWCMPIW